MNPTDDKSLFTDVTIDLSLPSFLQSIQSRELPRSPSSSQGLELEPFADFGEETIPLQVF